MVVVGLDYGHAGQMTLDEITGGSPYGATTTPAAMARACRPRTSSKAPAIKAKRLPRPPTNCMADISNSERKTSDVLQHIGVADPQSSRRVR